MRVVLLSLLAAAMACGRVGYESSALGGQEVDAAALPAPDASPRPDASCETCGENECVSIATDPRHCGACGMSCATDLQCVQSACRPLTEIARATAVDAPQSAAIIIGPNHFVGWNFEVPAGTDEFILQEAGYWGVQSMGTLFAAVVRLDGPRDFPDAIDLSSADVIATGLSLSTDLQHVDVTIPISASLVPGWYAIMFGSGAFGASAIGEGRMHDDQVDLAGVELPYTLIQDQDRSVYQGVSARAFVRGIAITP